MRYGLIGCPPCGWRTFIREGEEFNPGHPCPQGYPSAGIRLDDVVSVADLDQDPEPEKVA